MLVLTEGGISLTLSRQDKELLQEKYVDLLQRYPAAVFVEYSGFTVSDAETLRRALRPLESRLRIIKNSIFKLALERAGLPVPELSRTMAVVFLPEDVAPAAKALNSFMKDHESLMVRFGFMDGRVLSETEVKMLASLPTKDEARAQLIAAIEGPLTNLVRVVQAPLREIAQVLHAYSEKEQEAA